MTRDPGHSPYEEAWDGYSRAWPELNSALQHLGDEWTGQAAGAATSLEEYCRLIEARFITPWIAPDHTVLEIGVGGGRTAALLAARCDRLICADVSMEMLNRTRARQLSPPGGISFVKLEHGGLDAVPDALADVCFCYDTMVHMAPEDIFQYLTALPRVLRGPRLCILHHGEVQSELGFRKFLADRAAGGGWRQPGLSFPVMTRAIMQRFLDHLGYQVLHCDTDSVPRDCVWVCRAPA
jgi:ubiquinone/menaquinone biosynthesis C-methylase UbiE